MSEPIRDRTDSEFLAFKCADLHSAEHSLLNDHLRSDTSSKHAEGRIRKDFVKACSKISPSASQVFWARWRNRDVSGFGGNRAESWQKRSKRATGFALTILARRRKPANGGCEQFRLGTENDRDQAKRIAANQCLQFTRKNRDRSRTMAIAATLSP